MRNLLGHIRDRFRKWFPTREERVKAGYEYAQTFEGDIDDLEAYTYGSTDAFDEGIRDYIREHNQILRTQKHNQ